MNTFPIGNYTLERSTRCAKDTPPVSALDTIISRLNKKKTSSESLFCNRPVGLIGFFTKTIDNEVAGKESTQINPVRVPLNNFSFAKIP